MHAFRALEEVLYSKENNVFCNQGLLCHFAQTRTEKRGGGVSVQVRFQLK